MSTRFPRRIPPPLALTALLALGLLLPAATDTASASSHREAPFITQMPKVDATDFYMFRSYEPGRDQFVTLIANYQPLQDPYGGPNYFTMDPQARYEIHVDNDGDAVEDLTFRFRFANTVRDIQLAVGPAGDTKSVSVALNNIAPFDALSTSGLNVDRTFVLDLIQGDRRTGPVTSITSGADTVFPMPQDNIGDKSIPDYPVYAATFVREIDLPGTTLRGRMFVGQRKDPFVVNLGEVFDLVNTNPLGPVDGEQDDLDDKSVTSLILELPIDFLTGSGNGVVGAWTSASLRQARVLRPAPRGMQPGVAGGAYTQVSRLGMPLVNEVVIGLKDKDAFNASEPKDDAQFFDYVTHPTLPELLQALFGVDAPNNFPRLDLVATFATGYAGVNQQATVTPSEMLRLNTAIAATPQDMQHTFGVVGDDLAGFPNGRRPGDDVVDIALRVVMGRLLYPIPVGGVPTDLGFGTPGDAPSGLLPFTDGAAIGQGDVTNGALEFQNAFPYLNDPLPGATAGP